ncbi:alpha-L-rhamnosidase [Streptococcus merionis]|uniref:alpha-L-rhamnosidase n=1 Tax=Streptococcus merionis TaxID=400065 RepID=UPI0026EC101F|nr:alpha-L-rhamnosidase [Streptococcus merionis]
MNISSISINHLTEPLGFEYQSLHISFKVEAESFLEVQKQVVIAIDDSGELIYQSDFVPYDTNAFDLELDLSPRTRYQVTINLKTADGAIISGQTFFETGKRHEAFTANWIANQDKSLANTLFRSAITIDKEVVKARLYMAALGVYETSIDGQKVGDEFLAPGFTAYDKWVQVQTYDITDALTLGKHELLISTADGWYKGKMGFEDGGKANIYGDQHRAIAEYHITYADGSEEVFVTDESWETTVGQVTASSIYYGEDLDATLDISSWKPVIVLDEDKTVLQDRLSPPLRIQERLDVQKIIKTPAGETVLDFGQNQAGILEFYNREPKGTKLTFQMGEILQEGNFYRDNFRHARAAFEYISDGEEKWVRPSFTYYGYRYVKVEGNQQPIQAEDFKAAVIYSDMAETGHIRTQNAKVNRLFDNIIWGQKSNFFDVPTDCPQRDERLGWTGDADVFSSTAVFNMNSYAFFRKWLKDVATEQQANDGRVPHYAPAIGDTGGGAAVWGDATTVVPWTLYKTYGDTSILREHFDNMKAWVDWIGNHTDKENLWIGQFQFGDWLALDGENPALPTGKTDEDFIASVYYYYSAIIVANAAELIGKDKDAKDYRQLADQILAAIRAEFITKTGRMAIDTQTAYALALQFNLVPDDQLERVATDLVARLKKDDNHLKTGFVGTPFINQVLSQHGYHKLATKIFLLEDLPSWLYAVNMGATTVWERWNSVMPDGLMNPEGMNSLNHYSIGAIMDWAYRYILGLRHQESGYQKLTFAPEFDYRLNAIEGCFDSVYGPVKVSYQIEADENHRIQLRLTVPFGMTVAVNLPRSEGQAVLVNNQSQTGGQFEVTAGVYDISYIPSQDYVERYTADTPAEVIMADEELVAQIDAIDPVLDFFRKDPGAIHSGLGKMSLAKLNLLLPFIKISDENLAKVEQLLTETPILNQR